MKNLILFMCMVALSTSVFSQFQMRNDTIYSNGETICVIYPSDNVIVSSNDLDDKNKKSILVLCGVEYPDNKFEFFTSNNSPELTGKENRQFNRELSREIKSYPLKNAGKNLREGASILAISPVAGGLLIYAVNPAIGGIVSIGGFILGYAKLIKAGEELENYQENDL